VYREKARLTVRPQFFRAADAIGIAGLAYILTLGLRIAVGRNHDDRNVRPRCLGLGQKLKAPVPVRLLRW
jgi:hypothetical protein